MAEDAVSRVWLASGLTDTWSSLHATGVHDSYIFDMQLFLPNGPVTNGHTPSALGLHRLSDIGSLLFAPYTTDSIFVYNSSPFRTRTSNSGLVLVTQDSMDHTEGVLFGVDFQSPTGPITDRIAYGTYSL